MQEFLDDRAVSAARDGHEIAMIRTLALCLVLAQSTAHAQDSTVPLRGDVVLLDEGVERVPAAGTMDLWIRRHGAWTKQELTLDRGHFEASVPADAVWIDASRLVLDGRDAWCALKLDMPLPAQPSKVIARHVKPCALRIVDARAERDLDAVELVELGSGSPSWHPPSETSAVRRTVSSPYALPLWDDDPESLGHGWIGARTYLARAPGRAWASITIDPTDGGTRTLLLAPEAVVAVRLEDGAIPDDVVVELRRDRADSIFGGRRIHIEQAGRAVEIDALPEGRYWVVAELREKRDAFGITNGTGRFLALELVDVAAGDVREVRFTLRDRAQPIDARGSPITNRRALRGTLRVPAEWNTKGLGLNFQRYEMATGGYRPRPGPSALTPDPADPTLFHWDAGVVEAGAWLAITTPIPWSQTFVVAPGLDDVAQLVMPPPADVSVRIVDAVTGLDIERCELSWYAMPPPQPSSIGGVGVGREVTSKRWRFRATQGEIVLMPIAGGYQMTFERATVASGENEIVLKLTKLLRVRVVAYDGDARLAAQDIVASAAAVGGRGTGVSMGFDGEGAFVDVDAPGTYAVTLYPIDGYESPPEIMVDVEADKPPPVATFRLRRTKR